MVSRGHLSEGPPFSHRCLSSVAGAQSLFALTKRGRRFALASLLVKTQVGVADAWVREGMTKAEADALIAQIVAAAEAVEVSSPLVSWDVLAERPPNARKAVARRAGATTRAAKFAPKLGSTVRDKLEVQHLLPRR